MNAPRSIDEYLKQLRAALAGADPALIQDALYDAEEYLRAEVAAQSRQVRGRRARADREHLRRARGSGDRVPGHGSEGDGRR